MVHGGPDWDHSYLLPPVPLLAQHATVTMFDLRGCGRSQRFADPSAYQPRFAVDDILGLAQKLGLDDFTLLGFSYGGQLAAHCAARQPNGVNRLVLASTGVRDGSAELRQLAEYRRRTAVLDFAFLDDPELDPAEKTRRMAIEGHLLDIHDERLARAYLDLLASVRFSGEWMRSWRDARLNSALLDDPVGALRAFSKPILILHGEHDLRYPVVLARELDGDLDRSHLHVMPGVGHMAHFEATSAWARAVIEFLEG